MWPRGKKLGEAFVGVDECVGREEGDVEVENGKEKLGERIPRC